MYIIKLQYLGHKLGSLTRVDLPDFNFAVHKFSCDSARHTSSMLYWMFLLRFFQNALPPYFVSYFIKTRIHLYTVEKFR